MDQKTNTLIEAAEDHAALDDNYDVAEHARDDVPALCEVIRAQDARLDQIERLAVDAEQAEDAAGLMHIITQIRALAAPKSP